MTVAAARLSPAVLASPINSFDIPDGLGVMPDLSRSSSIHGGEDQWLFRVYRQFAMA